MKIKFDASIMKFMSLFSTITKVDLKDCFIDSFDTLTYVVRENELGRAIGKAGFKARMLEKSLNRKIKILEFNPDLVLFVQNVVYPLQLRNVEQQDGLLLVEAADSKTRGLLIGRAAQNLRNYENIIKRYFPLKEIRVK